MDEHRTASREGSGASGKAPPPWVALSLVGHHLDAKSLATASCASKSWLNCLSSDHLWQPLFSASFPALVVLPDSVPCHRLYSAFHNASKRRHQQPPKPALSLHSLLFMVSLSSPGMGPSKTVIKPCKSLEVDPNGLFRFDLDINEAGAGPWAVDALDGLRVTWHVVVDGWKEVFCMMECRTPKIRITCSSVDGWFSEELPSPGCCSKGSPSGLVGELRLGVRVITSGGAPNCKIVVDKVSVGVLSIFSWRYVTLDDALRYLQHFLQPC